MARLGVFNKFRLVALAAVLLLTIGLVSACGAPAPDGSSTSTIANEGDTVKVLYVGTLDDGTVFDSSELQGGDPLQFTIGSSNLIPGFEQAVIGMRVNETKNIHILSDDAYGPSLDSMVVTVNWSSFEGFVPEVGEQIQMQNSAGQTFQGIVIDTSEKGVTVDFNHPLAGRDLNFEITVVEIVTAPETATLKPGVTLDWQNVVEVIYTHRANRCTSCVWAEDNLRWVVDTYFGDEVADGKLVFMTINVEDVSNSALVNKLGAYTSQIFINKIVDGEEEIEQMTSLYLLIYDTQAYRDAAKAEIEERLEDME
ncbi:MAG: nitrophenyl compound nitroreductase subunit ArsF family protein [Dehalococcoidia bacterium]